MKLIVSEKAIAGRRIANILSNGKATEFKQGRVPFWTFDNGETVLVPLSGHIVNVDFPKEYSWWTLGKLQELVNAPMDYNLDRPGIGSLLKKEGKKATELIIATDADREGESIGLEAIDIVKQANKNIKVKRAIFSAITPEEVNKAFEKLEDFDYNLADAANARREIDLAWGAALTRFISIVSNRKGRNFLSIGRVQTPTLGLIVEKEKEIQAFVPEDFWVVSALLNAKGVDFTAIHAEKKFKDKSKADEALAKRTDHATVTDVKKSTRALAKPVPFHTTDFLRAAIQLGFGASQAMNLAESLYVKGYLSYPRTDTNIYPASLDLKAIVKDLTKQPELGSLAEEILRQDKIVASRGNKDAKDHPPVHPVTAVAKKDLLADEWRIYDLVVRRFLATLAWDAEVETLKLKLDIGGEPFQADGQRVIEPGWTKFYPFTKVKEADVPELASGDQAKVKDMVNEDKQTQPPARYSQGTLLKKMSDLLLGTKATRPDIIAKLYARDFIKGKKKLEPTLVSFALIDNLVKYNSPIATSEMTAKLEENMDLITAAKKSKAEVVKGSKVMLSKVLVDLFENKDEIGKGIKMASQAQNIVGKCPACDNDLLIRYSRFGKPFIGCSSYPECTQTFPLPGMAKSQPTGKSCEICTLPVVKVMMPRRRPFEMCINPLCKSKESWGKKKKEKESKDESKQDE